MDPVIDPILYQPLDWDHLDRQLGLVPPRVCILIATKNGQETVYETVKYATGNAEVFLVSDGSTDNTVEIATQAGAQVLDLAINVGKPSALREGFRHFDLEHRYDYILILDDDTRLDPYFVHETMKSFKKHPDAVAVSGRTSADWPHEQRWNGWVAARAMSYWRYNWGVKVGQSAMKSITVLPGSNTVFRTDTFAKLLARDVKYIVDDTQWCLDIQTEKMGRIVHNSYAKAYVQDPSNLRDYYKQMLRWMWGSFQGVRGHRIGRHMSWFSFTYSLLIIDWFLYVVLWPTFLAIIGWRAYQGGDLDRAAMFYVLGYFIWVSIAALFLRKWRLPLLTPWIIAMDWINRWIFVHSFFKAWRQPTVESCKWDSPTRLSTSARKDAA
jgi:cellulose synthase/poly-beta-1,6-N-acetylglucosamine synthase-like glycosyltransferase